ncbi:MAG: Crp/Fnr family transcriptional regulator [Rhizobiaceae bacterium]|nr:Crp/Fnr family transcriptional regulator [Rhizobiaceae bacterium]
MHIDKTVKKTEFLAQFPSVCDTCSARLHGVCGALSSPELAAFGKYTYLKAVKKGDIISFDADDVTEYANIVSGTAKLSKIMEDGRQQILGLQFAPEFMGRPYSGTAHITIEAATDMELCVFPKSAFEMMTNQAPSFEHRLLQQTLVQLDTAREWMVTLGRKTATEKVATFLLLLAKNMKIDLSTKDNTARFEIPITRNDIADFLGLTIETVSRQITKLRKARIIVVENHSHIFVPDIRRLESCCEN